MRKTNGSLNIKVVSIFLVIMLIMPFVMFGCDIINNGSDEKVGQNDNKVETDSENDNQTENNGAGDSNGEDLPDGETAGDSENNNSTVYVRCDKYGNEKADGDYILFGEYPQSIKADNVTITDTKDDRGYYLGSDGFYYAMLKATPCTSYYTFTTGAEIDGGAIYYFKVEPIRWRILSEENGEAFLLCDSIIANQIFDDDSNNYAESNIRAWLNSVFYETAFDGAESMLILTTEVDNSAKSTNPYGNEKHWNNGVNKYACENTNDKIFLLSEEEATNSTYGFKMYEGDSARIMLTSDYSRATGAYMNDSGIGWWWLRSPYHYGSKNARGIIDNGDIQIISVQGPREGVVPALKIEL